MLRGADGGARPLRGSTPLTRIVFPMKVYEYLAAGLPVVTTPLPALVDVRRSPSPTTYRAWSRLLEQALAGDTPEQRRARSAAAAAALVGRAARRDRRGADAVSRMLVTPMTPVLGSGAGLRTYGVVAALARHGAVEVAYATFGAPQPDAAYERLAGVTLRALVPSRGAGRALAYAGGAAPRRAAGPRAGGVARARPRGRRRRPAGRR